MTSITEQAQKRAAMIREIEKAGWHITTSDVGGKHTITLRGDGRTIRWFHPDKLDWEGAYDAWKEQQS